MENEEQLTPEEELVTRLNNDLMPALSFINAIRYIRDKIIPFADCIPLSPPDLFLMDVVVRHYYGCGNGGTHTRLPDDVCQFIYKWGELYTEANRRIEDDNASRST